MIVIVSGTNPLMLSTQRIIPHDTFYFFVAASVLRYLLCTSPGHSLFGTSESVIDKNIESVSGGMIYGAPWQIREWLLLLKTANYSIDTLSLVNKKFLEKANDLLCREPGGRDSIFSLKTELRKTDFEWLTPHMFRNNNEASSDLVEMGFGMNTNNLSIVEQTNNSILFRIPWSFCCRMASHFPDSPFAISPWGMLIEEANNRFVVCVVEQLIRPKSSLNIWISSQTPEYKSICCQFGMTFAVHRETDNAQLERTSVGEFHHNGPFTFVNGTKYVGHMPSKPRQVLRKIKITDASPATLQKEVYSWTKTSLEELCDGFYFLISKYPIEFKLPVLDGVQEFEKKFFFLSGFQTWEMCPASGENILKGVPSLPQSLIVNPMDKILALHCFTAETRGLLAMIYAFISACENQPLPLEDFQRLISQAPTNPTKTLEDLGKIIHKHFVMYIPAFQAAMKSESENGNLEVKTGEPVSPELDPIPPKSLPQKRAGE
ncbi:hypothetical protein Pelo_10518 [Pelomyxa schiedti]|nr:hypothetical protein Pelo_10518 [Pelomyxa schiedti]